MLGSMYSAVSGLAAHQTKMNVIGNNIANVNTYGFKASRVTFSDVFYQTMTGASGPTSNSGGTNPVQLGYGAKVKSIDVINTRAGSATTDRALDVYINGDGYLPVKDNNGIIKYTRVGVLNFDLAGNLVDSSGNMVLGIPLDPNTKMPRLGSDGTVSARDLVPIKVDPKDLDKFTGITIGSNGEITAIKEGDPIVVPAANTGWLTDATVTSSTNYNGNVVMTVTRGTDVVFLPGINSDKTTPIAQGAVTLSANADINGAVNISFDGTVYTLSYIQKDGSVKTAAWTDDGSGTASFDVESVDANPATVTVQVGGDYSTDVVVPADGTPLTIGTAVADSITVNVTTYDKSGSEVHLASVWDPTVTNNTEIKLGDITLTVDPARFGSLASGALNNTTIGTIGPGAGQPVKIANIAIVKFANSDGLSQSGEGYYVETANSGQPVGTIPGNGGTGTLRAGALEMSNVDLSREFTEMIIAQRGFQANTRMITVSDEMLAELVSMKR